jgi:hypothetical protein
MSELIQTIENSLELLDQNEASLIELANKYSGLKINGLEDRQGYISVREGRLALKAKRVQTEKDGKSLRDNAIKFQKAVIKRENELIAIIEPVERELQQQEESYNALKEQQRLEEERKEKARVQLRIDALAKFNHACDLYELTIMEEENFQALLGEAQAAFEKEQERIAAEKAEAERQRIAEQERLRVEREELDRQRAEFNKREAELKAMREKEQAEQRAEQDRLRKEHEVKEAALRAEREKIESEKRAMAEARFNHRASSLERMGFSLQAGRVFVHNEFAYGIRLDDVQSKDDKQFALILDDCIKDLALQKEDREKKLVIEREQARIHEELERERQEALKPDKEKILNFLDGLISGKTLILETSEGVALMNAFSDQLRSLIADFKDNLNQL